MLDEMRKSKIRNGNPRIYIKVCAIDNKNPQRYRYCRLEGLVRPFERSDPSKRLYYEREAA